MNCQHVSNYNYVVKEYAKEIIHNDEKEKCFLDGVSWAFDAINHTIRSSVHPLAS